MPMGYACAVRVVILLHLVLTRVAESIPDEHDAKDCRCWAAQGQCQSNAKWMLKSCPASCEWYNEREKCASASVSRPDGTDENAVKVKELTDALDRANARIAELEQDFKKEKVEHEQTASRLEARVGDLMQQLVQRDRQLHDGADQQPAAQKNELMPEKRLEEPDVGLPDAHVSATSSTTRSRLDSKADATQVSEQQAKLEQRIVQLEDASLKKHSDRKANFAQMTVEGEQRASDLLAKVRYLEELIAKEPDLLEFSSSLNGKHSGGLEWLMAPMALLGNTFAGLRSVVGGMSVSWLLNGLSMATDGAVSMLSQLGLALTSLTSVMENQSSQTMPILGGLAMLVLIAACRKRIFALIRKILWLLTAPIRLVLRVPLQCCQRVLQKRQGGENNIARADMGQQSTMYYCKEKKKWRERGKEHLEEEDVPLAPPPTMGSAKPSAPEPKKEVSAVDALMAPPPPRPLGRAPASRTPPPGTRTTAAPGARTLEFGPRTPLVQTSAFGKTDASKSPRTPIVVQKSAFGGATAPLPRPDASKSPRIQTSAFPGVEPPAAADESQAGPSQSAVLDSDTPASPENALSASGDAAEPSESVGDSSASGSGSTSALSPPNVVVQTASSGADVSAIPPASALGAVSFPEEDDEADESSFF